MISQFAIEPSLVPILTAVSELQPSKESPLFYYKWGNAFYALAPHITVLDHSPHLFTVKNLWKCVKQFKLKSK